MIRVTQAHQNDSAKTRPRGLLKNVSRARNTTRKQKFNARSPKCQVVNTSCASIEYSIEYSKVQPKRKFIVRKLMKNREANDSPSKSGVRPEFGRAERCELCGRAVSALTKHHLIPRTRHKSRRSRRMFSRHELRTRLAWLCRPCHRHIHALLENKQLELDFNTLESLSSHPDVQKFVNWIRRQPDTAQPRLSRKGSRF
jgi:hypothetical protein